MITLHVSITEAEQKALKARAEKAMLPLTAYIVAAAINPHEYAWLADVPGIETKHPRKKPRD